MDFLESIEVLVKNLVYKGRLVTADTMFTVSANTLESIVRNSAATTWGWKLRDGVVMFYVPDSEAAFVKSVLLNRKILAIVL